MRRRNPKFSQHRRTIYTLKKSYGQTVDFYYEVETGQDARTGNRTALRFKASVRNAIVLPSDTKRDFTYDLAYIADNKEFTTGAFYDAVTQRVLIDRRDLPSNWPVTMDSWLVFQNKKWEVKNIRDVQEGEILELRVVHIENTPLNQQFDAFACHTLELQQSIASGGSSWTDTLHLAQSVTVTIARAVTVRQELGMADSPYAGQNYQEGVSQILEMTDDAES